MKDVLRLVAFSGFVGLALLTAWAAARWSAAASRRAVNLFLVCALAALFVPGLTQHEAWPFSTWPLVAAIHPENARQSRLMVVDRDGVERDVDYRAWQPFVIEELLAFTFGRMQTLPLAARDEVAEHLLRTVEGAVAQVHRGGPPGYFHRVWGPFTAPYFLLHPTLWHGPADVPPTPLTGLRLYSEQWNLEQRAADPSAVRRVLIYGYVRR